MLFLLGDDCFVSAFHLAHYSSHLGYLFDDCRFVFPTPSFVFSIFLRVCDHRLFVSLSLPLSPRLLYVLPSTLSPYYVLCLFPLSVPPPTLSFFSLCTLPLSNLSLSAIPLSACSLYFSFSQSLCLCVVQGVVLDNRCLKGQLEAAAEQQRVTLLHQNARCLISHILKMFTLSSLSWTFYFFFYSIEISPFLPLHILLLQFSAHSFHFI